MNDCCVLITIRIHRLFLAKSLGYHKENVLSFCDAENHRPLHSSVIGKR